MNKLKTLTALFMALSLSGGVANAKLKLVKIAKFNYVSETIGELNMTQEGANIFEIIESKGSLYQYNRYNEGTIKGKKGLIPDGTLIHGTHKETFHIEGEGENAGFLATLNFSILWKDDNGYTYTLEGTGFAKYPPRAFPIFFETGVVELPNFYEVIGGQFRTNNPALSELNESAGVWQNKAFSINPDGTFNATSDIFVLMDDEFTYEDQPLDDNTSY